MSTKHTVYEGAETLTPGELKAALRNHDTKVCLCSGCALQRDRAGAAKGES
jgi:hypothetical protein